MGSSVPINPLGKVGDIMKQENKFLKVIILLLLIIIALLIFKI